MSMSTQDADESIGESIRLQLNIDPALLLAPIVAGALGFASGVASSSSLAARQFLAENAHRQPTTVQGWYFYQKTKNYRVLWAGAKGGLKHGGRLAAWTAAFIAIQEQASKLIAHDNFLEHKAEGGALAGGSLGLLASRYYRMNRSGDPRRIAMGLLGGGLAGALQDFKHYIQVTTHQRNLHGPLTETQSSRT